MLIKIYGRYFFINVRERASGWWMEDVDKRRQPISGPGRLSLSTDDATISDHTDWPQFSATYTNLTCRPSIL
jgi:hypothetical protein